MLSAKLYTKELSIDQKVNKETSRDIEHPKFRDVYIKISYKVYKS